MDDNRAELLKRLDSSHQHFCRTLEGLSSSQWNFKATRDHWSVFEVAEHLATVEDRAGRMLEQLAAGPALSPSDRAAAAGRDQEILDILKDRTRKQEATETVAPMGRFATPADTITALEQARTRVRHFVESSPRGLREYGRPHALLGMLDGYQWVLFLTAHMERHLEQMREIKATPGFPER